LFCAGLARPQDGHADGSAVPQFPQNLLSTGTFALQIGHCTALLPRMLLCQLITSSARRTGRSPLLRPVYRRKDCRLPSSTSQGQAIKIYIGSQNLVNGHQQHPRLTHVYRGARADVDDQVGLRKVRHAYRYNERASWIETRSIAWSRSDSLRGQPMIVDPELHHVTSSASGKRLANSMIVSPLCTSMVGGFRVGKVGITGPATPG
jgi:hypothetical protein